MCFPVSPAPQSLPSAARHPARPVSFHGPRFLSPPDLQAPATPLPPPCYGCSRGLATSWAAQPLCKVLAPWRPACVQPARYPTTASDVTLADTREPRWSSQATRGGEERGFRIEGHQPRVAATSTRGHKTEDYVPRVVGVGKSALVPRVARSATRGTYIPNLLPHVASTFRIMYHAWHIHSTATRGDVSHAWYIIQEVEATCGNTFGMYVPRVAN